MTSFHTKVFIKGRESLSGPQTARWMLPGDTRLAAQLPLSIPHTTRTPQESAYITEDSDSLQTDSKETSGAHQSEAKSALTAVDLVSQNQASPSGARSEKIASSTVLSQAATRITSLESYTSRPSLSSLLSSHLLLSDTASETATSQAMNTSVTTSPGSDFVPTHNNRTVVLACVLGGVLGLVGCAIIGFCIFNFSGWYKNYKIRGTQHILSPSVAPLEKIDSNDPLAHLDDTVEVRRGSAVFISSPLADDNILRLKGLPPIIPHKNPLRQTQKATPPDPEFYDFQPRPDIRSPRPAPPPPRSFPQRSASLKYHDKVTQDGMSTLVVEHDEKKDADGSDLTDERDEPNYTPARDVARQQGQHRDIGHVQRTNNDLSQASQEASEPNSALFEQPKAMKEEEPSTIIEDTGRDVLSEQQKVESRLEGVHGPAERGPSPRGIPAESRVESMSMARSPLAPTGSPPTAPDLEPASRISMTSSFYSNNEARTPATPLTELRLNIARTSQTSFANVMNSNTARIAEPFLAPIRDEYVDKQEEPAEAKTEAVAPSLPRNLSDHESGNQISSTPELYDDGQGEYPQVLRPDEFAAYAEEAPTHQDYWPVDDDDFIFDQTM